MRLSQAAVLLLVAASAAVSAQTANDSPNKLALESAAPITVQFNGVLLSEALYRLGRRAGVSVALAPDVKDTRVEATFINSGFEDALVMVVTGECLTYKVIGERSVLVTKSPTGGKRKARGPSVSVWPNCSDGYVPPGTASGLAR